MAEDRGQDFDVRMAEVEQGERSAARRESELLARERELSAHVLGVDGRCRVLQKKLLRMRAEGVPESERLFKSLPRIAPPPGVADRLRGLRAREEALDERVRAIAARMRALAFLDDSLKEAQRQLVWVEEQARSLLARLVPLEIPDESIHSLRPDDRRRARRVRLDTQISLNSRDNFFSGFARDLSEGGLFISTFDHLPVGDRLDIHFSLPGGLEIEGEAVVRWVRDLVEDNPEVWPGMGLEFIGLTPEAEAAIHRFMALRDPIFYVD